MNTKLLTIPLIGLFASVGITAHSQVIDFTGGAADWTFFYDSSADSWDVVLRTNEGTHATGLTNQADQDRHGANSGDYNFDTLNVVPGEPQQMTVNGRDYFATSSYGDENQPDLGIRTRLREDEDTDQFQTFTVTLDWDASTRPEGAEFALFDFDQFGNPVFQYETAEGDFTQDWDVWGHSHWHWGFTEVGDYELVFDFQGQRDDMSFSSVGTTAINFEVIPEPTTVALIFGFGALGLVALRRRLRADR